MAKQNVEHCCLFDATMRAMTGSGLLIGAYDAEDKPNLMTIGWGLMGSVWGIDIWAILVRPSRYTYECIEHTQAFTVNVPRESMTGPCAICGCKSGRDIDKFAETQLTHERASTVHAPAVPECPLVYECEVIHSNDVLPGKLIDEIRCGAYADGDFHRVFWGRILATRAEPNACELLRM